MPLVTSSMNITSAFKESGLIPDANTLLGIKYPGGQDVALGNKITPEEASSAPEITFVAEDPNAYYTLIMTDPDAPSRADPKFGEWRHWIVTNIPGDVSASSTVQHTPYIGPGPPEGSSYHRYCFLLFKQKSKDQAIQQLAHETRPDRRCFRAEKFGKDNDLELVAANFFLCKNSNDA
ncbi:phosphatidylethanolamine-binding protein [Umbelopsis sp. PMI_123]|nr:phosphatidylethanolamine-binding protein [Umbelopsis sp. PMI_123]